MNLISSLLFSGMALLLVVALNIFFLKGIKNILIPLGAVAILLSLISFISIIISSQEAVFSALALLLAIIVAGIMILVIAKKEEDIIASAIGFFYLAMGSHIICLIVNC